MRVGIVTSELPYPPSAGNRLRTLNLLLRLSRRHKLTVVSHRNARAEEVAPAVALLASHGIETRLTSTSLSTPRGTGYVYRLARNLLSPRPFSVDTHCSDELLKLVDEVDGERLIDLWHAESSIHFSLVRNRSAPAVLGTHNVETLIWERYLSTHRGFVKRLYISNQARKFARFEKSAFQDADRVVSVSEEDSRLIARRFGRQDVRVVENGITPADYGSLERAPVGATILFLGSLDWRPNLDAIGVLLDEILPLVRVHYSDAQVQLVGRKPPASLLKRVEATAGVTVFANVPDVRPFLANAAVMAVPLRVGGGSRLKILESLAAGLPVVSSSIGAEGLRVKDREHLTLADEPAAMARAICGVFQNPLEAQAQALRGRQFVTREYDWDRLALQMSDVWMSCQKTPVAT